MGQLLAALIAESETDPPAIPAIPATFHVIHPDRIAESQESQGSRLCGGRDDAHLPTLRARLLDLAKATDRNPAMVDRIPVGDLPAYAGMNDAQLTALLSMLTDAAARERGMTPGSDTAAILCRSCGPVWAHPAVASALPIVDGWPCALGCPWCFIRKRGLPIPRPRVSCAACQHRIPDPINPPQGWGRCAANGPATWPHRPHRCDAFRPRIGRAGNAAISSSQNAV
jgi:hypothetical protein